MRKLTSRQEKIIKTVVEHHIATGKPVGSKCIRDRGDFQLSPSTIRSELARLEDMGYLKQPHVSAGRVPTDTAYRSFVDNFFEERVTDSSASAMSPENFGEEIEDALRKSAKILAGDTGLLALVSAPSRNTSVIKHIEVLHLQTDLIMVVVITEDGEIIKKLFLFDGPVDSGLVNWARGYLNDATCGLSIGSNILRIRLSEDSLCEPEATFLNSVENVFDSDSTSGLKNLYVEGVPEFFSNFGDDALVPVNIVRDLLERQEEILMMLRSALMESRAYSRIGREMPSKAMSDCSLIAANYGVARCNLGAVGVLGPIRIDYSNVIGSVEETAHNLSRFVEERFQA